MTDELRNQCQAAGLTTAEIKALELFYALRVQAQEQAEKERKGGKGVRRDSAVKYLTTKTAIDNRDSQSIFSEIMDLSHTLFGGFTPGQVRRLLAVMKYKGCGLADLKALMYELRRESWRFGWVRVRDAVECLQAVA